VEKMYMKWLTAHTSSIVVIYYNMNRLSIYKIGKTKWVLSTVE